MCFNYIKTWIKRVSNVVSDVLRFRNFNWISLWNSIVQETILTVVTITVTISTMSLFGVNSVSLA